MRVSKVALAVMLAALAAPLTSAAQSRTPNPNPAPNERPSVKLVPSVGKVTLAGCGEGEPAGPFCPATSPKVKLSARATDPDGDSLLYTYTTTGGRVEGEGPEVTLDLTGVAPGVYTVKVKVDDGNGGVATDSAEVTVERCTCDPPPTPRCPAVTVECVDTGMIGAPLVFKAKVSGGEAGVRPSFNWAVQGSHIFGGQGTDTLTVEPPAYGGTITATVEVGGYDRSCSNTASCTTYVIYDPGPSKVGEYDGISLKDEEARLADFAVELRNDPTAQGYLLCYGGRRGGRGEASRLCGRALKHIGRHLRDISAARLVTVDGGYREESLVELWVVPSGVSPPVATPTVDPGEVTPSARPRRAPRRRGRRWRRIQTAS